MIWIRAALLCMVLMCAGCASASTAPNAPHLSVDPRIPAIDTPMAGVTSAGIPVDTNGITQVDIAIIHDASGYPAIHATLADSTTIGQFVNDVHRRTIGAPEPGAAARYACSEGATATYTVDVHQGTAGYELTEQICNGGLLSGELSGDVRGFLGDLDGLAATE